MATIVSWSGTGLSDVTISSGNVTSQAGTGDTAPTNITGSVVAVASNRLKYDQAAAVAAYLKFPHATVTNWSARVKWTTPAAWGASTAAIPFQAVSGSTLRVRAAVTPSGNLQLQKAGGTQVGTNSTGTIPTSTDVYIKMWAVLDATVGEAHCVVVDTSGAVLASVDVTGQNLGGSADQSWLGALATTPTLGTFYLDDFQVFDTATMPATPGGTGGGGTPSSGAVACVLGDSLTYQGGTGVTNIRSAMSSLGWTSSNVLIDGLIGRTLTSGSDGRTVNQCIDDLLTTAGKQPAVWIIALGTNNLNSSGTWASGISGIVAKLEAVSPGVPVKWINVGIRSDIDAQDTRVEDFNAALTSGLSGHASFTVANWNGYVHNGRDESNPNLWNVNDSTGYHMAPAGWTLRSGFYATSAGAPPASGTAGTYGDPLQKSLNRLAGTTGMDAQGAANVWAGTTGLDLLGALNAKNASVGLGLNAVLNSLAGTTGLDADGAAVQILA